MINPIVKTIELPDGRTITLETGKLAKQADGSVMLRMGNTMLLATVCAAKDAVPGTDFMPLQVEYKEKFSAFGRFPGGFTKREGRASDYEILTCRLVDRALRPLFPDNFHAEVYVNIILFSADGVDMPDALARLAASAALAVSDIPFNGPISEVRVARINGQFVINPTFEQLEQADMDLMVGATYENIMMVEGEMDEVSEQDLLEAMKAAHEAIKIQCKAQMELAEEVGSTVKREYCHEVNDEELRKPFTTLATTRLMPLPLPETRTSTNAWMLSMPSAKNSRHSSPKKNWKKRQPSSTVTITMWKKRRCAVPFWTKASALTDVRRPKSVLSGVRPATCPALTVPLSLHVAKHSLCLL